MIRLQQSLLTPCVFPMVPITVSFFTKRNEKGHGTGLRDSIIYALGIIITFTGLGVILAFILGATGIRDFAANPILNLMIAILFIVFALNLFGAFEIQIPTSIMNKLHSKSQSGSGITSVLLMGLTFSLTSFTCTVPFVGSALFSASQGDWFHPIVGMLGFSTVFAAPFFLLALFPSAMTKLPKAGGWMNNIKVVMGFMEIAAALKFISNADLVWDWGFLSRELFLAIWIAIGILVTLYILGVYSLKLDSKVERIGAPRAVFAILFFSFSFYLIPGLLGKPVGELDAFLPPNTHLENTIVAGNGSQSVSLEWIKEYDKVIEEGKKQNKTVFLDFTGWTCTNCRWMEANVFPDPEVQALFSKMVLGKLYTDRNKEPELSNKKVQKERFQSVEMPLYVLLTPDGELIATKAFTRNKQEFIDFLKKGVK